MPREPTMKTGADADSIPFVRDLYDLIDSSDATNQVKVQALASAVGSLLGTFVPAQQHSAVIERCSELIQRSATMSATMTAEAAGHG